MTIAPPSPNQKRMDAIRRRVGAAMPDWTVTADETGTFVTAADGPDSERVYRIEEGANLDNREMALSAPEDLRFLLRMYDALSRRFMPPRPTEIEPAKPANYAAECAMRCGEQKFRTFLSVCHGIDVSDDERIRTRIHSMLRITSRAILNTDPAAASRWRDLVRDFESWERSR
ncbi:hypothetical protein [Rhizobium sp. Leaf383]|uniref:hypothetical protein n=1 Tax=Rhizobium sp. Leaf383 TaxID=1736357 RepID=UPI00071589EA|nr:hypothetical protein [Rhizobium sp. Leaf383]KQS86964.1 hypothetical protein ASG58_01590 [Rhizobium sp. Leaf383]